MKSELTLDLNKTTGPLFIQIAEALRNSIKSGQLEAAEALPSARTLATKLNTNRHTVMAGYQELVAQGWVESIERKGYRVAANLPIETAKANFVSTEKVKQEKATLKKNEIDKTKPAHEYRFNFAGGSPDIEHFPFKTFKSYLSDSLLRANLSDLNYGNTSGNPLFLEQVEIYLRRVRAITHKDIITVNGSQEALYLTARVLLRPGDKVAVEALGYAPAWRAFKTAGAELVAIKQNAKGIDLTHLSQLLKRQNIKLLYLTPLHQYPTTLTIGVSERMMIYRLAAEHNVTIIEDDYDHEFHYDSQPLAPMAADDPLGKVIYLSTFSKIMFPGCRIGFIAAHPEIAKELMSYREIVNHKPNALMQNAIARWMQEGAFERHLRKTTKLYHQRRDHMVSCLNALKQMGIELEFSIPGGGMALWVDIKRNAMQLQEYCAHQDIYLMSEPYFHLNRNQSENRFIRIGYAGLNEEKAAEGIEKIGNFLSTA